MMNDVVDAGTCCACGCCVLVCPHNVIEYIDNIPKQTAKEGAAFDYCGVSEGVGCDVCSNVCPRLLPREAHLTAKVFEVDRPYEDIFGVYRHIFVVRTHREDIRERAQDGGIVTALLVWALNKGVIDSAVVSAVGENDKPCFPSPQQVTTEEEIKASSGSWYTYCANNLALKDARERDLKKVAFVGVPCQITPLRKMEHTDPDFLVGPKKREKVISRQRGYLRDLTDRIALNIGLFCTEVFLPELLTEGIEKDMGIPLTDIAQFNVKGEILIYKKNGDMQTMPLKKAITDYQRMECQHCADFSAELSDIACDGVSTSGATIVVIRTQKGEDIWRAFEVDGGVETTPIQDNKRAWNILLRLARKQKNRVPEGTHRSGTAKGLRQYSPADAAEITARKIDDTGMKDEDIIARMDAANGDEERPEQIIGFMAGQPISGDPGDPLPGEKRKLPPPPAPVLSFINDRGEVLYQYYKALCDRLDIGIAMWSHPDSGYVMQPEECARIADLPNIVAVKYSVPRDMYVRLTHMVGDKIHVSTSSEDEWLDNIEELGWQLYLCSSPPFHLQTKNDKRMDEYTRLAFAGEFAEARSVRDSLNPVRETMARTKPADKPQAFGKYWQELLGQVGGNVRPPMLELTEAEKVSIREGFETCGLKL